MLVNFLKYLCIQYINVNPSKYLMSKLINNQNKHFNCFDILFKEYMSITNNDNEFYFSKLINAKYEGIECDDYLDYIYELYDSAFYFQEIVDFEYKEIEIEDYDYYNFMRYDEDEYDFYEDILLSEDMIEYFDDGLIISFAINGDIESVIRCISNYYSSNTVYCKALVAAIKNNHYNIAKIIIKECNISINYLWDKIDIKTLRIMLELGINYDNILLEAVRDKNYDVVQILLDHGADSADKDGYSIFGPFKATYYNGDTIMCQILLNYVNDLDDLKKFTNKWKESPIKSMIHKFEQKMIKFSGKIN